MRHWRFVGIGVVALTLLCIRPASATPTLDQYNFTTAASGPEVRSDNWLAQTFTVGLSGALTQVEVWNFISYAFNPPDAPLIVELHATCGGIPVSTVLASATIPITDVGVNPNSDRTVADFTSSPVRVSSGQMLAMVLRTDSTLPGAFDWWGSYNAPVDYYPLGSAFASTNNGVTWHTFPSTDGFFDFHFWTYVDAKPVPEPSTLLLLSSGLAGVGGMAWRRQRRG